MLGAGSGVSSFAVQLAAQVGARVLVTSSSDDKIERASELGAYGGSTTRPADWVAWVKERGGVDVVIDSVGSTWPQSLECLRPGGRCVVFGATGGTEVQLPVRPFYFAQWSLLGTRMGSPADFAGLLAAVENGAWRPVVDSVRPLAEASAALEPTAGRPLRQAGAVVQLSVTEWGDPAGAPVVCLHGVTGHGRRFRRLAEERLPSYRVIGVDYRGHGRSTWEPPWSVEQHVADLVDTADALGIQSAAFVGHSFGGKLVAELAARHPDRVERAVLLDPALHIEPPVALERAELTRVDVSFASADEAIDARLGDGSLFTTARETLEEEAREHLVESARRQAPVAVRPDRRDRRVERDGERAAAVAAVPDARRHRRAVLDPAPRAEDREHRARRRPRRAQRPVGRLRRDRRRDRAVSG